MPILEVISRNLNHCIEKQSFPKIGVTVGRRLEDIHLRRQELEGLWQDSVLKEALRGTNFEVDLEYRAYLWSKMQECDVLSYRVYTESIPLPCSYLVLGDLRLRLPCFQFI